MYAYDHVVELKLNQTKIISFSTWSTEVQFYVISTLLVQTLNLYSLLFIWVFSQ